MEINMNTFENYFSNISKRFEMEQDYISEDCIRYDFFYTLSKICKLAPSDLILEYPLSKLINGANPKQEIDCVIDKLSFVCECKFWKKPRTNNPQTKLEGQLFDNVFRLHEIKSYKNKWLIVILNDDMLNHLNRRYNLFDINQDTINIKRETLESRPNIFRENVGDHVFTDISIKRLFFRNMNNGFSVSIFSIL
ncbi:MAG: hypothetical protein WC925_04530 [Bacilli bacterium]|jgi:hypothetical protein